MLVQSILHSWQMNEHLLGINICFYLKKIDKLFMLQHYCFVGFRAILWIALYQQ